MAATVSRRSFLAAPLVATPLLATPLSEPVRLTASLPPSIAAVYAVIVEGVSHKYKNGRPRIAHVFRNGRKAERLAERYNRREGFTAYSVAIEPRQNGGAL